MVTVEELYKYWEAFDADKDKIAERKDDFAKVLEAVNAGPNEKKLASQLIGRFFKHFPSMAEQALNAMFDLCEDDDAAIRKTAIRDLPALCKDTPDFTSRIADVLTQLFQADEPDQSEILLLHASLMSVFRSNFKGAVTGVFTQIEGDDSVVREKAIAFLAKKLSSLPEDVLTKENEDFLMVKCKESLKDVSGTEFLSFMQLLTKLKVCQTVPGRQQLADIVYEQLECGGAEFKANDPDSVDRVRQCVKQALPYFSKNVPSTKYVEYMCENVLPVMRDIKSDEEGDDVEFELLKILAELTPNCRDMDEGIDRLGFIFLKLLEYMPLPPQAENGADKIADEPTNQPQLLFSHVECLLIAFHNIGRQHPEFLTDAANGERLKDFRKRLQYFAYGSQAYLKQLKASLTPKSASEKTEEEKIKVVALRITMTITTLIRDLMHNPPKYKAEVTPSWKPVHQVKPASATESITRKRSSTETSAYHDKKSPRGERVLYAPPSGKFSEKAGEFKDQAQGQRGGGRGRGQRGQFRGRGRSRGRGGQVY